VAVLVVLVHADAVEAERVGVFELVHVLVVHEVPLARVVELGRDVDPHRAALLPEVVGQVRPGHQVEPRESHGGLLSALGWLRRLLSMGSRTHQVSTQGRFFRVRAGGGGTERSAVMIHFWDSAGSMTSSISKYVA